MNYHNITKDDMNNGDGLRVVLWVAGCDHHCKGCQNPVTWNSNDGIEFDIRAKKEIFKELKKKHIAGITFSGGDPLFSTNKGTVFCLCQEIKKKFPTKTIWIYTGYDWETIMNNKYMKAVMKYVDVLVDGEFIEELKDVNYPWAGSTNQRVIDVQKSLKEGKVILHESN